MSNDLVKSAARAMEILEVFAERREPLSSAQLGAALGYPKSSLSVLIRSLVAQGFLSSIGTGGEYFPTMKVTRLGDWIPAILLGSESFLPILEGLRDSTGETVTLTIASGNSMRVIHALIGTHPISLRIEEGVNFPIIGTAVGTMYLATQTDAVIERALDAWAAHSTPAERKRRPQLREQIEAARASGFARAYDAVIADTGAIAMAAQARYWSEPLILAVAGLNLRIHKREAAIMRAMQKTVAHALAQADAAAAG